MTKCLNKLMDRKVAQIEGHLHYSMFSGYISTELHPRLCPRILAYPFYALYFDYVNRMTRDI